jgi:hypothetical protein
LLEEAGAALPEVRLIQQIYKLGDRRQLDYGLMLIICIYVRVHAWSDSQRDAGKKCGSNAGTCSPRMWNDIPDQNYNRDYNGEHHERCEPDSSLRCPVAGAWGK